MKQPDKQARRAYFESTKDKAEGVQIPGTKRIVKLRGLKPYTIERLTELWIERDAVLPESSSDTLKSVCIEPYFSIKEAVLFTLNSFWKIKLLYALKWRIWAYLRGYTEEQMLPILKAGKKKLPLTAHWMNMAFCVDMREDWMKMTTKEAEQYRAELLSAAKELSAKNSPTTGKQEDSSLV